MSDSSAATAATENHRRHHRRSLSGWLKKIASSAPSPTSRRVAPIPKGYRNSKGVFGVPICESICYARATVGYVDESAIKHRRAGIIPLIVAKCGAFLKEHGLQTEGIFRLSGNMRRVNALQVIFNDPRESYGLNLNWLGYTCHDAATILLRYLNKLPEPVIPHNFYQAFRDVMSDKYYHTNEERVRAFQQLIQKLPIPHQHLLLYLLDMLSLFSSNACETRMDSANLAAVFAPGILSHPDQNTAIQYRISQRVLEFLIEFQALFTMQLLSQQQQQQQQQPITTAVADAPPPVPPLPSWLHHHQHQQKQEPTTITPRSSKSDPLVQSSESLTSPYSTKSHQRTDSGTDVRTPYSIKNTEDEDDEEEGGQATPRAGSPAPVIPSPSISSRSTPKQNGHQQCTPPEKESEEKKKKQYNQTESLKKIWQYTQDHIGYYTVATMGTVVASVIIYEAYQAIWGRCCFEPYIFFSCFVVYWTLLARSIAWPDHVPKQQQQQQQNYGNVVDQMYEDEDDGLSLFDDISVIDRSTEEAMLRDISCEWHSLFTRAWRDNALQEDTKDAELLSTMSASSRFNEEMEAADYGSDGDYDDDSLSVMDIDSEDLKTVWLRFQQVQEDAELAAKLQHQEGEVARQADSINNPFLNNQQQPLTKSKSSEEWKIRYYNKHPQK